MTSCNPTFANSVVLLPWLSLSTKVSREKEKQLENWEFQESSQLNTLRNKFLKEISKSSRIIQLKKKTQKHDVTWNGSWPTVMRKWRLLYFGAKQPRIRMFPWPTHLHYVMPIFHFTISFQDSSFMYLSILH